MGNWQYTLRNTPRKQGPHLHRAGSLKTNSTLRLHFYQQYDLFSLTERSIGVRYVSDHRLLPPGTSEYRQCDL
jgi:hypothetical protein